MSEVSELERELDKQRRKVEEKRDKRNDFRKLAGDKSAQIHDLRDRAGEARDDRDENRKRLVVIRDRIEAVEVDGVEPSEQERYDRLIQRQEAFVDDNEELTALLHRVLPNIAEQAKRREEVRDLRERFGDDLDHAIQRKDRIKKALKEAKEDAASNVLGSQFYVVPEFNCHEGGPVPTYMYPHLADWCNKIGDPMRIRFGPSHVNSGHRWEWYDARIGGVGGYHVYEKWRDDPAGDLTFAGGGPAEWAAYARQLANAQGRGGVGQYLASGFVHADTGPRRDWSG